MRAWAAVPELSLLSGERRDEKQEPCVPLGWTDQRDMHALAAQRACKGTELAAMERLATVLGV